ncbi:MAG: hypothetical protein Q4B22_00540 [Eubacteriales bacterium]|nr:hypothetical protein [Eubacteriales bacterium]
MIRMTLDDFSKGSRQVEKFCRECELKFPEEVAKLFIAYTEWIWQYKYVGTIYQFYCEDTVLHTCDGDSVGVESVIANTLSSIRTFPDQTVNFVDIFAEGNEEDGYYFGQCTEFKWKCDGWSAYGAPTGKALDDNGKRVMSMCECRVAKIDGRWRIAEEWLVRSHEAMIRVQLPD